MKSLLRQLLLLLFLFSAMACQDGGAREELSEEDTSSADTSQTIPDTSAEVDTLEPRDTLTPLDTTSPSDTTSPPDTQDLSELPSDIQDLSDVSVDPCAQPPHAMPTQTHGSGGAVITLVGMEFSIGALWWCVALENESGQRWVAGSELYTEGSPGLCQLSFMLPPMPPGEYSVRASYGCQFDDVSPTPGLGEFGSITITPPQAPLPVAERCFDSVEPCEDYEVCHSSLGQCVGDICRYSLQGWWDGTDCATADGDLCAPVVGCVSPNLQCQTASDCRIAPVGCGCLGVHSSDPRAYDNECFLGGCIDCDGPPCSERYTPFCDDGLCTLMPAAP